MTERSPHTQRPPQDNHSAHPAVVTVVDGYGMLLEALRDSATFKQWDGVAYTTVRMPDGTTTLAPGIPLPAQYPSVPFGPFCFAATAPFLDAPEHGRFRSLLIMSWDSRRWTTRLTGESCARTAAVLADYRSQSNGDVMRDLAVPVAYGSLAWLFGDDEAAWIRLAREHPALWGPPANGADVLVGTQKRLWDQLVSPSPRAAEGALGRLLDAHHPIHGRLSLAEIHTTMIQTMLVGARSLAVMLSRLAESTCQLASQHGATDRESAARSVYRSLLRYPPQQSVFRRTLRPWLVGGKYVPAGGVELRLGASPDRCLPFGAGPHMCPAASIVIAIGAGFVNALRMAGPMVTKRLVTPPTLDALTCAATITQAANPRIRG